MVVSPSFSEYSGILASALCLDYATFFLGVFSTTGLGKSLVSESHSGMWAACQPAGWCAVYIAENFAIKTSKI